MVRPIRKPPILFGKNAARFDEEMKRVESISAEERRNNRENTRKQCEKIRKEWNLTYEY